MSHAGFIWANLRRRPLQTLMTFACVTLAFTLYGLSLGLAEGFHRAALAQQAALPQQFMQGAVVVSAVGMALILVLVANAMAHAVRLRLHEFGVLKALGFSHRRIIVLVVAEAAVPCLAGAASGLIVAQLLFAALSKLLPPLATFPTPVYTLAMLVTGGAIALLIASISAVVPALRIIRLDAAAVLTGSFQAPPVRRADTGVHQRDIPATQPATTARDAFAIATLDLRQLRQVAVVALIGLSTLRQRIKGGLLVVASVGCMVFVLLSILAMGEGIRTGMLEGADPSRVVLRPASSSWLNNVRLPEGIAELAAAAPGVAHASDGTPLAEAVTYDSVGKLTKRNNDENGNTSVVGVGPLWPDMTPTFRLLTGRIPQPGAKELIAGPRAVGKFSTLDSGFVRYQDEQWRVVGTFTTGTWWDGFLVAPAADVRLNARRPGDSAVLVRLTSPEAFEGFRDALASRLPATVTIEREPEFYASYWQSLPKNAIYIAVLLTIVFGAGAMASMMHVMHAALQERSREIATLRVLGFSGAAVAASVVLEGMLLATLGALSGAALAWAWVDGFLYNGAWTVFEVTVNLHLLFVGTGVALAIALIGTLPLAVRTARQSELEALNNLFEAEETAIALPGGFRSRSFEVWIAALTRRRWKGHRSITNALACYR